MLDLQDIAKTLKAARLMHERQSSGDSPILTKLRDQDLREAAHFIEKYPLIAEIMMRRGTDADEPPADE